MPLPSSELRTACGGLRARRAWLNPEVCDLEIHSALSNDRLAGSLFP
jgi:hypothetical protein